MNAINFFFGSIYVLAMENVGDGGIGQELGLRFWSGSVWFCEANSGESQLCFFLQTPTAGDKSI